MKKQLDTFKDSFQQHIFHRPTTFKSNSTKNELSKFMSKMHPSKPNRKNLKIGQHGANMHYCRKKVGDVGESLCRREPSSNFLNSTKKEKKRESVKEFTLNQITDTGDDAISLRSGENTLAIKVNRNPKTKTLHDSFVNQKVQIFGMGKVVRQVIGYLTMTETIAFQNLNKNKVRKPYLKFLIKQQRYLIINTGLTRIERIRLWYNKTQILKSKKLQKGQLPNQYRRLAKKPSLYNSEILIDVERTYPHIHLFPNKDIAQEQMVRILTAIANQLPDFGYVQGMNFIAASLLLILMDEETTFYMLIQLLQKFKLKDMYLDNFNQLKLLIFQLESFIQAYNPSLHQLMSAQQIETEYFATRWFLTLFTYDLSIEIVSTVLDLFMIDGFKCLIKISLAVLNFIFKIYQEDGFNLDSFSHSTPGHSSSDSFANILKHFSEELRPESHNLITQACTYKVTTKLMSDMERQYNNELRLQQKGGKRSKTCRSSSLRDRMLMIEKNVQNKKFEWIVLPTLPSKCKEVESEGRILNLQKFEEWQNQEIKEETEIMSIFSENEEVNDAEEVGINKVKSHKKPCASKMVHTSRVKQIMGGGGEKVRNGDSIDTTMVCYDLDISLREKDILKQPTMKHKIRKYTQRETKSSISFHGEKENKIEAVVIEYEQSIKNKIADPKVYKKNRHFIQQKNEQITRPSMKNHNYQINEEGAKKSIQEFHRNKHPGAPQNYILTVHQQVKTERNDGNKEAKNYKIKQQTAKTLTSLLNNKKNSFNAIKKIQPTLSSSNSSSSSINNFIQSHMSKQDKSKQLKTIQFQNQSHDVKNLKSKDSLMNTKCFDLKDKQKNLISTKNGYFESHRRGMESPKLQFVNQIRVPKTITMQNDKFLPFPIKNLDTGEVTNEDPFLKDVKIVYQ